MQRMTARGKLVPKSTVELMTLGQFVKERVGSFSIRLLKMDTEGAEIDILRSGMALFRSGRVGALVMELGVRYWVDSKVGVDTLKGTNFVEHDPGTDSWGTRTVHLRQGVTLAEGIELLEELRLYFDNVYVFSDPMLPIGKMKDPATVVYRLQEDQMPVGIRGPLYGIARLVAPPGSAFSGSWSTVAYANLRNVLGAACPSLWRTGWPRARHGRECTIVRQVVGPTGSALLAQTSGRASHSFYPVCCCVTGAPLTPTPWLHAPAPCDSHRPTRVWGDRIVPHHTQALASLTHTLLLAGPRARRAGAAPRTSPHARAGTHARRQRSRTQYSRIEGTAAIGAGRDRREKAPAACARRLPGPEQSAAQMRRLGAAARPHQPRTIPMGTAGWVMGWAASGGPALSLQWARSARSWAATMMPCSCTRRASAALVPVCSAARCCASAPHVAARALREGRSCGSGRPAKPPQLLGLAASQLLDQPAYRLPRRPTRLAGGGNQSVVG
eukprot:scaffold518_cov388-Prasinococcus_capsulatus_cf.AAC.15